MSQQGLTGRQTRCRDFVASGNATTHQGDNHYNHNSRGILNRSTNLIHAAHITILGGVCSAAMPTTTDTLPEIIEQGVQPFNFDVSGFGRSHTAVSCCQKANRSPNYHRESIRTSQNNSTIKPLCAASARSSLQKRSSISRIPRLRTLQERCFSSQTSESQCDRSSASDYLARVTIPRSIDLTELEEDRNNIDVDPAEIESADGVLDSEEPPATSRKNCHEIRSDLSTSQKTRNQKSSQCQNYRLVLKSGQLSTERPPSHIVSRATPRCVLQLALADEMARLMEGVIEHVRHLQHQLEAENDADEQARSKGGQ